MRPTLIELKSLFSIFWISIFFDKICALDLSGSGNISYELASRGVKKITSVEKYQCVRFISTFSKIMTLN